MYLEKEKNRCICANIDKIIYEPINNNKCNRDCYKIKINLIVLKRKID